MADAAMDARGYVMATVPATPRPSGVPTIGFLAHVDTSPEMPGADVKPIVHERYDGRDLVLPDDPAAVLRAADDPALAACLGDDIVTASGLTCSARTTRPAWPRSWRRSSISWRTPRSRTARSGLASRRTRKSGAARITSTSPRSARCAPTRSTAAAPGELEYESFSADAITVTFKGFNTHPGYAKGQMVNAIKIAADFIASLPKDGLSPETTDGYEGYVHPYQMEAGVDRTSVRVLLRDFVTSGLADKAALVERLARQAIAREPRASVEFVVEQSYRNMREVLDLAPDVIDRARRAIRADRPRADREAHPRRHRRIAAVVHGAADAEPLHRRAQLPLAAGVDVTRRAGARGRGDRRGVLRVGGGYHSGDAVRDPGTGTPDAAGCLRPRRPDASGSGRW